MLIWGGGGVFTKLKQCKQTTGPKSVVPGAEMHRTGGRNPSYHVIINCKCPQSHNKHSASLSVSNCNTLFAELCKQNIDMALYLIGFLDIKISQVVESSLSRRQLQWVISIVNIKSVNSLKKYQHSISEMLNPLRAKFFRVNIDMSLHFMSFLHIDMTQVLKILPQIR